MNHEKTQTTAGTVTKFMANVASRKRPPVKVVRSAAT
jgi:hypothetical protein